MFNNTKLGTYWSKTYSINAQILSLAVPSILANITVPLVGIVDTAIVGHLSDAVAIGGIAIGTMLFDLLYWNFSFLRAGTGGMTAQAYGQKNVEAQSDLLTIGLATALVGALLIWLIQWLYVSIVLQVVPCSEEVANFARSYFFVRIWAAPATLSGMVFKGWFIGMQDSMSAMLYDLTVNISNIVVSYLLAYRTGLGVMGVAWGTLIAQYLGLCLGVGILVFKYKDIIHRFNFRRACGVNELRRLFAFNGNLMLRSACMLIIYVGFTSLASRYGNEQLAVSSIMMKMFLLFSYFVDGFAYAGEALTGKYIGSKDFNQWHFCLQWLFAWTAAIGLLFTLVYAIAGTQTIALLTSDINVIEGSRPYIIWMVLMPLISCAAFMWDGIYIGATAGREIRNSTVYAAIAFVGVYVALSGRLGIQALYAAYFSHLAVRFAYLQIMWHLRLNKKYG